MDGLYFATAEVLQIAIERKSSLRNAVYNSPFTRPVREGGFGQRFLEDEAEVFSFNAFDDVDWPAEVEAEFQRIIETQREAPISEEEAKALREAAGDKWEEFYLRNKQNFFMDRKWLTREFAEICKPREDKTPTRVLEAGCGVGNSVFPLLEMTAESNPDLFVFCCDFSPAAVQLVREHKDFNPARCRPFVWDITDAAAEIPVEAGTLDHVLCVFVLSAIPPEKLAQAIANLVRLLKKDGCLFVKDYGRFDLTQMRFKKQRYIAEDLYARGDKTLVHFFDEPKLHEVLTAAGLRKEESFVDKRMINKKQLLRLACETLKHRPFLSKLLAAPAISAHAAKCRLFQENEHLDLVVVYEIVIGRVLKARNGAIRFFAAAAKADIKKEVEELAAQGITPALLCVDAQSAQLPRYCRVNTLKASVEEVVEKLEGFGFRLVAAEIRGPKAFRAAVGRMESMDFLVDRHVPELLVFHPRKDLHDHFLASCLPAFLLNPPAGSSVVDACAAPGMKTSHLAAIMRNQGKIYAMDRDRKRCGTLERMLEKSGVEIATVANGDFLKENTSGADYAEVEYALVDPPCSGSGMAKRNDFLPDEEDEKRTASLANLQSMLLKHALRMPNLKRLVYSTCSVHEAENEGVVADVLQEEWVAERFELVDVEGFRWKNRGRGDHEFASKCLRADPAADLTNGFFIAVFQARE
ncbi:SAM-MT-RSMB-NOP domain-containing protein [Aphelenchoides fujianensis]|nr:SAM-MT-RSMB-NOP domain-containing protein [Aphelenchoides fujianensis]